MRFRALIAVFIFATFFGSTATNASSTTEAAIAADPVAEKRLQGLSEELRCLVCQNQTLADSDADLAVDLRRQVESLVAEGRSDQQIKDYLVERYGDFVLYRPPVQRNTLALWIGPFALLGVGFAAKLNAAPSRMREGRSIKDRRRRPCTLSRPSARRAGSCRQASCERTSLRPRDPN